MSSVNIISHGKEWILNGQKLTCPECNTSNTRFSDNIKWDIKRSKLEDGGAKYSLNCKCLECDCRFEFKRLSDE